MRASVATRSFLFIYIFELCILLLAAARDEDTTVLEDCLIDCIRIS